MADTAPLEWAWPRDEWCEICRCEKQTQELWDDLYEDSLSLSVTLTNFIGPPLITMTTTLCCSVAMEMWPFYYQLCQRTIHFFNKLKYIKMKINNLKPTTRFFEFFSCLEKFLNFSMSVTFPIRSYWTPALTPQQPVSPNSIPTINALSLIIIQYGVMVLMGMVPTAYLAQQ